jgi:hypothetical protein
MLAPRSAYPRTWRQLRPELAATAAAGAALLQAHQLPQLADKQRVDAAELETLAALSDAMAAYREVLAEENDFVHTLRAGMSAMKHRVAEQRSIFAPTTWLLRST